MGIIGTPQQRSHAIGNRLSCEGISNADRPPAMKFDKPMLQLDRIPRG
jgi:hypothetical protein